MASSTKPLLSTLPRAAWLMLVFPVAVWMHFAEHQGLALFVICAVGILGTVTLIGKATEEVAGYAGPVWGGLLNATFGNVTELIIALLALKKGMFEIVRASITGSILGNLLLVLGAAMVYGGIYHPVQKFSRTGASASVSMLWVTLVALLVPTLVEIGARVDPGLQNGLAPDFLERISFVAALILLAIYLLHLLFSLKTHRFLLMPADVDQHGPEWSKMRAAGFLFTATVTVAMLSDFFVESMGHLLGEGGVSISPLFMGVIIVATVGNAAEGMVAVWVARHNKMDLAFQVAMGSCLQVALLVAPVLVLASFLMGTPMTLSFNLFELMALGAGVLISSSALNDGETNWLEGAMFLAVYFFFAVVFWYHH